MSNSGPMNGDNLRTRTGVNEAGFVTAFVVVMVIVLLLVTGLVFDGGRAIVAKRHAINVAEQAARAGAQAVDIALVRSGGPYRINPSQARRAALAYLAAAGETGTVAVGHDATGDLVSVAVPFTVRSSLLTLAGLPVLRGTGQASARNCQGVVQEENC
jgi:Flp pilus assembly protein TadG